jgi:hypothetical protein
MRRCWHKYLSYDVFASENSSYDMPLLGLEVAISPDETHNLSSLAWDRPLIQLSVDPAPLVQLTFGGDGA